MPRLPGWSGSSASSWRPYSVIGDGLECSGRPVHLHHRLAVRLRAVRGRDLPDLALDAVLGGGEGEGGAPLPGPGLRRQLADAFLVVVVGLRHRRVRLVRAGRADALVLVVDAGRGAERPLQPAGPEQRARPPEPVDVEHTAGDVDVGGGGDLLLDQGHREQRRQVVRADRLPGPRVQRRRGRRRQIGDEVVPLGRLLGLVEQDLRCSLGHGGDRTLRADEAVRRRLAAGRRRRGAHRARPAGRDRDALDHGRPVARDAAVPRRRRRRGPGGRGVDGGAAALGPRRTGAGRRADRVRRRRPPGGRGRRPRRRRRRRHGRLRRAAATTLPRPPDDRPVPAGPPRGRRRDDAAGVVGRHRHRPRPLGAPSRRRPLRRPSPPSRSPAAEPGAFVPGRRERRRPDRVVGTSAPRSWAGA